MTQRNMGRCPEPRRTEMLMIPLPFASGGASGSRMDREMQEQPALG